MKGIIPGTTEQPFARAAKALRSARKPVALTGAGISVGSGIPDFRSPDGLWSRFAPDEYATLDVFYRHPAKAWQLYRALGRILAGKQPNPAHQALAELEAHGLLHGIITQNIDRLHQQADSRRVFEIHGDHQHLHCLRCERRSPLTPEHLSTDEVPHCPHCDFPLKPNVVLFGEAVRDLDAIHDCLADCDLLLVIGTEAQVYPAAALPTMVQASGGRILECNQRPVLTTPNHGGQFQNALFIQGDVVQTLPQLVRACLGAS